MWWLVLLAFAFADKVPQTFNLNLDDPPETRWVHIQKPFASTIKQLSDYYVEHYGSPEKLDSLPKLLDLGYLDEEFKLELRGLAQAANITYNEAVFLNYMYEYNAYCTSIVARMKNGTIMHARNLDYDIEDFLRRTTVNIDVYQQGKLLFKITGFAWYLGVCTGMKPGVFSVSLNQRNNDERWLNNLALMMGFKGDLWQIRKALTNLNTYEEVVDFLEHTHVTAPSYYILGDVETHGSVITRGRFIYEDYWPLTEDKWYLVQTNYDHWEEEPARDNKRRQTAIDMLESIGQENLGPEDLFKVLSTFPVLNPTSVYTTVMVPSTGYLNTTIRI